MPEILDFASRYKIDPVKLIIELTKVDKINLDRNILQKLSEKLQTMQYNYKIYYKTSDYIGGEQDNNIE
jgi:hypothetical protein